jgi:hypothetical protein
VVGAITGGGLYLTVLGAVGFRLGATVRASAGAIVALFGLLFLPPLLLQLLPLASVPDGRRVPVVRFVFQAIRASAPRETTWIH